jgi:hypothetical protein
VADNVRYYVCSVANSGRQSLRWSPPLDSVGAARKYAAEKVRAGDATLAVVVAFGPDGKAPLEHTVYPESAKKIVRHWLDICDACEQAPA